MLDTSVHLNVNQQPNDAADAARLYGQLMEKAQAEVAGATVQTLGASNEVKFIRIDSLREPQWLTLKVRLVFSINGTVYDIVTDHKEESIRDAVYGSVMQQVFDQCVKALHNLEAQAHYR